MRTRPLTLAALGLTLVASASAAAQGHRRTPPPPPARAIPMEGTVIEWSVFVSAYGEGSSSRTPIAAASTPVTLPEAAGWACTVGTPTRAAVDTQHWSEVRTLECQRGDATVSTTGFCQIAGASWGARAGVLSLSSTGAPEHLQLTVDCTVRN
jgi:hypothetical protein